jgi:hypothetical protein
MSEHEPVNKEDHAQKAEARAARTEGTDPAGRDMPPINRANMPSDDAAVASEPMDLQRLDSDRPVPPGRQRTGDPPAR